MSTQPYGEHAKQWDNVDQVLVDTEEHIVTRNDDDNPVVGRTRTTPTKHNGTQRRRSD